MAPAPLLAGGNSCARYNALLAVKQGILTTVLDNDGRLEDPGLAECETCGDLVDPVEDDACPWCGEVCTTEARPGRVTITRGAI